MIKIKTSDLKTFLRRSKAIKQHGLMPILSFFKMDCNGNQIVCTDTNHNTFLIHEMPGEFEKNGSYLIDRKIINSVVDTTKSEFITITQKGKKIFISDDFGGSTGNNGFQTDDPTLYPKVPDQDKKAPVTISPDLMKTIQIAKHYCISEKTGLSSLESLHLKSTPKHIEVFASNRFLLYVNRIPNDPLELMITPDNSDALNGFTEALYYSSGNYDFYECGSTTYGFVKSDYKCVDYLPFIQGIDKDKCFTIERQKVLDYCNRVKSINPSSVVAECEIREAGKNKVLFYYNNEEHDKNSEVIFDVKKDMEIPDFLFGVDTMIQFLSSLPYEQITFAPAIERYFVLSEVDEEFLGLIVGLRKK